MLASATAGADTLKPGDERFKFVAGWFLPAFDTDVRIDDTDNEGDDVNLGDDLGLDQDQSGALRRVSNGGSRIVTGSRASWSQFSQTATRTIDEQITIGDEVFPIDAEVRTKWTIDLIPITYSYSFLKSDSNEFAATFGIHWDKISLSLNGSTSLSDDDITASTSHSADLPLPLIGLRYDHHFSDNWSAGISGSFFSIEFGEDTLEASGSLYNLRAYTEYRFRGRYGAGLAIDAFKPQYRGRQAAPDRRVQVRLLGPADLLDRALLAVRGTEPRQSCASRCSTRVAQAWNRCQAEPSGSLSNVSLPSLQRRSPPSRLTRQACAPAICCSKIASSWRASIASSTSTPCSQLSQVERGSRL